MSKILIGCDPEVFVKQNGVFKSAHGLIVGDKKNPQRVHRGAVQVDGMALEFNIDPAADENEFCLNVVTVLDQLRAMVPDYEIVATPVAHFDMDYIRSQPREALELGCDPDFNCWSGMVNEKPNAERPMRTAAGHVHIGWTSDEDIEDGAHRNRCNLVAQNCDFFLGLGSLMFDQDTERRSMYGKAGCVRYKSYGVEYRTMSDKWLDSEKLMRWVFRNAKRAVESAMNGEFLADKYGDIQAIINDSDVKAAKKIIKAEKLEIAHA